MVGVLEDDNGRACMFCETDRWAFGPIVDGPKGGQLLRDFLAWFDSDIRQYCDADIDQMVRVFSERPRCQRCAARGEINICLRGGDVCEECQLEDGDG